MAEGGAGDDAIAALTEALRGVRRGGELAPFHGDPKLDTLTPDVFIRRVTTAAEASGWNNQRTCREFYMCLRGKAALWYEGLADDPAYNPQDWPAIRRSFIAAYCPAIGALTLSRGFRDLQQGPVETVRDFSARISYAMRKGFEDLPVATINALTNEEIAAGGTFHRANNLQIGQALLWEGSIRMRRVFMDTLLRNGLRDDLRTRVSLREVPHNYQANLAIAMQEEAKVLDETRKGRGSFITVVENIDNEIDDLTYRINVLREQKGKVMKLKEKYPHARFLKPQPTPPNQDKTKTRKTHDENGKPICFNCGKAGHYRVNCHFTGRLTGRIGEVGDEDSENPTVQENHETDDGVIELVDDFETEDPFSTDPLTQALGCYF